MPGPPRSRRPLGAIPSIGLATTFGLLCGLPYLPWLRYPSLYHDDFMRAWSLRNTPIVEALFRPFNEHMAPLFEAISYLAWVAAGRRVEWLPTAFLVASFVGFGSTVAMLAAVVRREARSTTSAMVAVALFCLSSVSAETVLWYSACSFQWAASATLAAWYSAARAVDAPSPRGRRAWLVASAMASMAAPGFSAIGVLAAPLAMIRLLLDERPAPSKARRLSRAAWPLSGLALYLAICAGFRYQQVLTESLSRNLDLRAALWATVRAPSLVLFPSLVGMKGQAWVVPGPLAAGSTIAVVAASLVASRRGRNRPMILGGVFLISFGYLLAYGARARAGDLWIFEISRYHLFPQVGLVCLVVAWAGPALRRLDGRRSGGLLAATLLAASLATVQYRGMRLAAEGPFRFPDQPRLIATAAKLEAFAAREAIPLDQFFRTLDPIQPRWAPHPWSFHPVLFLLPRCPSEPRWPDSAVRDAVIAALSPEEREVLFGGMEATTYRRPSPPSRAQGGASSAARMVATGRISRVGEGLYEAKGGLAYLEYQVDSGADPARALCLPGLGADWPVEVWWADEGEPWSPDRSVRWGPDPRPSSTDWEVPIEALPHWRRGAARKLRIVAREKGVIAVGTPRFLR